MYILMLSQQKVVNLAVSFMSSETVEDLVIYKACVVPEGATLLDRSAEGFEHSAVGQILLKDDKDALKMMQKLDGKTVYGVSLFPLCWSVGCVVQGLASPYAGFQVFLGSGHARELKVDDSGRG